MERTVADVASDLMRLGKIDEACKIVEEEIERIGKDHSTSELWRLRFVRAQSLETQGQVAEALRYLESLAPPETHDAESKAPLKMYRGSYTGYLGRYNASHRIFEEAEVIARAAGLLASLGDTHLS